MTILLNFFQTIRVGNAVIAAVGIAIGWFFCNSHLHPIDLFLRIAAGFFALGYGNIINDICDIKTDKISHPNRPLASGKITLRTAVIFAVICLILSALAGFSSSFKTGVASSIPLVLLTLYSLWLKSTPFAGNFLVAALTGYTLIFGGLGENVERVFYPALLAFLANFAREIVKDLADYEGDKAAGLNTTAMLSAYSIKFVIYLQFIIFTAVSFLPFFTGVLGKTYAIIVISFVIPLHFLYIKYFTEKQYKKSSDTLKIQMIVGLIAVIADYFWKL